MSVTTITSKNECEKILNGWPGYVVLLFVSEGHAPSKQMSTVLAALAKQHPSITFAQVDASIEGIADLSPCAGVNSVPTTLALRHAEQVGMVQGTAIPRVISLVNELAKLRQEAKAELDKKLGQLVRGSTVMLFMKGSPEAPRCGFSLTISGMLNEVCGEGKYGYFDILTDEEVRQGLKTFSDWPTYPQLYIDGELVGGLDIVKEMHEEGELSKTIERATAKRNGRLNSLITQNRVMVFMKGDPSAPKCGFSRKIVELLTKAGFQDFGHFNILSDIEVREGLKKYSNWPTYPQLYVDGELMGGLDVVTELIESGELKPTG